MKFCFVKVIECAEIAVCSISLFKQTMFEYRVLLGEKKDMRSFSEMFTHMSEKQNPKGM